MMHFRPASDWTPERLEAFIALLVRRIAVAVDAGTEKGLVVEEGLFESFAATPAG